MSAAGTSPAEAVAVLVDTLLSLGQQAPRSGRAGQSPAAPVGGPLPPEGGEALEIVLQRAARLAGPGAFSSSSGLLAFSLQSAALVTCLEAKSPQQLGAIQAVAGITATWLQNLLGLGKQETSLFHEDHSLGCITACRLALHRKYPSYQTEGFHALTARPPVFYANAAISPTLVAAICRQLALPKTAVRLVECVGGQPQIDAMNVDVLERLVAHDISAGLTPVAVIAFAGTDTSGHVDFLDRIHQCVRRHGMWLHVQGAGIATMLVRASVSEAQTLASAVAGVDSVTLVPGSWMGLSHRTAACTLYRDLNDSEKTMVRADQGNQGLLALPLYLYTQHLGHNALSFTIANAIRLTEMLHQHLRRLSFIHMPYSTTRTAATLLCQYAPPPREAEKMTPVVISTINDKLWRRLEREYPTLIQAVSTPVGLCMRFAPLDTHNTGNILQTLSPPDIEHIVASISSSLENVQATLSAQDLFLASIKTNNNMRIVQIPNFVGLGVIQYVPAYLLGQEGDAVRKEITRLNTELLDGIEATRGDERQSFLDVFGIPVSAAQSGDGTACVAIGLSEEPLDPKSIGDLVKFISVTASELKDDERLVAAMAATVQENIRRAQADLERESEERMFEEGLIRHLPVVGSVFNWISPPPALPAAKGRRFTLSTGKVEATGDAPSPRQAAARAAEAASAGAAATVAEAAEMAADSGSPTATAPPPESPAESLPHE